MVSFAFILLKKTVRDLRNHLGQSITLSCVLAAGLSSLIMAKSNLQSLYSSQQLTYQNLSFADAVVPLTRIPRHLVANLGKIPGIRRAECRLSDWGQVRLEKEEKQISARFHSLTETGSLNSVKIVIGRRPQSQSLHEALLSDAFAGAWKIRPGDHIDVLIKGKIFQLVITGLVRSAEYIYQTGSATSIPDDKLFSAWWVHPRIIEQTSNLQSSCNEILLSYQSRRAIQQANTQISDKLKEFGFTQIIPRKRQLSHYFLDSELAQLQGMTIFMPSLFLAVTIFILNITMTRLLLNQRESIGTMRSFGFERWIIATQSFALALLSLLPGLLLGIFFGAWISKQMFDIYIEFYRFAFIDYAIDAKSLVLSLVLYVGTAIAGCFWGLRTLLRESPAATLRPALPSPTQATKLDAVFVWKKIPLALRMSLRNLFRRPWQSVVTYVGLVLSTALLIFARFEDYAIREMLDNEFTLNQRQSHSFFFDRRLPPSSGTSFITRLRGGYAEQSITLPITLEVGHTSRELTLIVKPPTEQLRKAELIPIKSRTPVGISLSKSLAEVLHVRLPQQVTIKTKEIKPQIFSTLVTNFSENVLGTVAVISQEEFNRATRARITFNTILFKNERGKKIDEKKIFSKNSSLVRISEKNFEKKSFEMTMAENIEIFKNIMIGFALLIALGVLYNNARVQFTEREREFALLRALGFYEAELTLLFWIEFFILALLALAPGLWLGRHLLELMMRSLETEIFRIPVNISSQSYVWASCVLLLAVFMTAVLLQPLIHRIAFLRILKARE